MICINCDTEMELFDSGTHKGKVWENFKCPACGYLEGNEPDWDDMRDK